MKTVNLNKIDWNKFNPFDTDSDPAQKLMFKSLLESYGITQKMQGKSVDYIPPKTKKLTKEDLLKRYSTPSDSTINNSFYENFESELEFPNRPIPVNQRY